MAICGLDCCKDCPKLTECGGCEACAGHPDGGDCIAAEYIKAYGAEAFGELKSKLIGEINALKIDGLQIDDLNLLSGKYVNLGYALPNGTTVKLLRDDYVYFGNQIEKADSGRCYGVVADEKNILVCEYGCYGAYPEIILYKKR